ncbi:MAG: acireductone synthase [Sphingomonas sp.]|uniref:acireductone synthase n=1 Tax=Sphingomonas sp. TaxID=28214 RepID=UPI0022757458|nr:acireductone synthase [Sphingomonas sp.]MCX8476727.1 acireductone synthase [Sphingomonas sp.]
MSPRAIVTDIEGTTSSIAFVAEVLFPYARAGLADFLRANPEAAAPVLAQVRVEAGAPDLDREGCIARLLAWHDADRKIGPLKTLQGMIWAEGYATGAFTGHVYPDAAAGLRRWHARGIPLYVYSSGSVAAQKLLFGHSDAGDLTPLFAGYFDTAIGAKRESGSYAAIARAIGVEPQAILFLSDVVEELDAAHKAGLSVILLARDGTATADRYPVASSFDAILPEEAA